MLWVSRLGSVVTKLKTSISTLGPPLLIGPCQRRKRPGKANSGRGSLLLRANQCHCDGVLPSGSQNDVAGTRQRRASKLSRQNFVLILSSRVLVSRLGA